MVVEMTDGFEVVAVAEDGEEAIELCSVLKPDLVLMDVQMPGIGGLEATRRIRRLDSPPQIVVMSTHESSDYRGTALDAGAFAFIPKSEFGIDALEDVWQEISSRSEGERGSTHGDAGFGCSG